MTPLVQENGTVASVSQRLLAMRIIERLVGAGLLPPARTRACALCEVPPATPRRVIYHHEDYSRPAWVIPLCTTHHSMRHEKARIGDVAGEELRDEIHAWLQAHPWDGGRAAGELIHSVTLDWYRKHGLETNGGKTR